MNKMINYLIIIDLHKNDTSSDEHSASNLIQIIHPSICYI